MAIVVASVLVTLAAKALWIDPLDLIVGPSTDVWRRALTAPFVYVSTGYEIAALSTVFLFGWLLERRHGPLVPILVFVIAGAGGMWVADLADPGTVATGGNGAALGLLGAWAVRDLLARRRHDEVDSDGLGVLIIAVLLVLLPAAVQEAHPLAGAAGGVIGLILGLPLARIRER
jgi:membrane associated rhomboid family serine protease